MVGTGWKGLRKAIPKATESRKGRVESRRLALGRIGHGEDESLVFAPIVGITGEDFKGGSQALGRRHPG